MAKRKPLFGFKEKIGQPWTYTKETKAKLAEDKASAFDGGVAARLAVLEALQEYQPEYKAQQLPRSQRALQALNGRRVSKTTAKVNPEGGRYTTHKPVMSEDLFKKLRELGYKAKDLK